MDASARPITPPRPGAIEDRLVDGCRAGGIGSPWPRRSATGKTSSFLAGSATAPMASDRGPFDGLLVGCRCELGHRAGGRPAGLGAQPATARSGCPGPRATSAGVPAARMCPHYADLERGHRREEARGRSSPSRTCVMLARPRAHANECRFSSFLSHGTSLTWAPVRHLTGLSAAFSHRSGIFSATGYGGRRELTAAGL
jgi:hypothetical protein